MAVLWEMSQRATQFCKAVVSPRQAQCSAGDAHEVDDALLLGGRRVAVLSGAIGRFGHDCRRVHVRRDVGVNRQRGTCRFLPSLGKGMQTCLNRFWLLTGTGRLAARGVSDWQHSRLVRRARWPLADDGVATESSIVVVMMRCCRW